MGSAALCQCACGECRTNRIAAARRRGERGVMLIDVLLSITVVALAMVGSVSSTMSAMTLKVSNRETGVSLNVLRHVVEEFETLPLEEVYPRFNADPYDDPDGAGTARGASFTLEPHHKAGLLNGPVPVATAAPTTRLPMTVEVSFPLDGGGLLSEMVVGGMWGSQGWDLNGDGALTAGDRSSDYKLLPLHVRVTWSGPEGPKSIQTMRVLYRRQ